ncbi:MAG: DUF554 domain-containing protein [Fastidiosipilaceae bacterium]|nr:DUF554 domain-containing protein [Clostridiaceae bacterium]
MSGLGTIVNMIGIIVGGGVGLGLRSKTNKSMTDQIMLILGIIIMLTGLAGILPGILVIKGGKLVSQHLLHMMLSLIIGVVIGEWLGIEALIERFSNRIETVVKKRWQDRSLSTFAEGFSGATILFCTGAMAILGSLQDGLLQDPTLLFAKTILDSVVALIFASSLGLGVLFSALSVGLYQGSLTALAVVIDPLLTDLMIENLSFVGSILVLCIGVNFCFKTKIRIANLIPALAVSLLLSIFIPQI